MGRDIYHQTLPFSYVITIHFHCSHSLHAKMARFTKKGKIEERKRKRERKTKIVEDSKGSDTKNNNVDVKNGNVRPNGEIDGREVN